MLKIERLRLPLDGDLGVLHAQAVRVLRIPPADLLSLRLLRRSLDAREEPIWICSAAVTVRNEAEILRRCRDRRVSSMAPETPYQFPVVFSSAVSTGISTSAASSTTVSTGISTSAASSSAVSTGAVSVSSPSSPRPPFSPRPGSGDCPPPVIVGAGPAGLFAALVLSAAGLRPILLERGRPVEQRRLDVDRFWRTGELDPESNVQFGEGGAGAFSDGKLNTGTRDPRHRFILEQFVSCGAPEEILTDAKPHIGTDRLYTVLQNLRRRLTEQGTSLRFNTRLADLEIRDGQMRGIVAEGPSGQISLPCRRLILCAGHSARDTFAMLARRGVPLEPKPFAVGVRVEHRQADIDAAQYREYAGRPGLPAASYKLSCHLNSGRGVFSFCVCPGGEVVAAASEQGRAVTNGMSACARDGENINGGLLVGVTPEDFYLSHDWPGPGHGFRHGQEETPLYGQTGEAYCSFRPQKAGKSSSLTQPEGEESALLTGSLPAGPLAGIAFQRRLETAAYALGGGGFLAPAQRVGDFLAGRPSTGPGRVLPTYRPGVTWTDLRLCLPPFIADSLREALPLLGRKLRGYDDPDAVLMAVESRSSSPVRIPRDGTGQSAVRGLYPCGEGAGYAGGILSAAVDGMRCAEQVCADLAKE